MNRIEKLIEEYCPEGVEFKKLGEVMNITRGASPRPIIRFITNDENGVPWIKIGDVDRQSKFITQTKEKITREGAEKSRFLKKGDFVLSNSMSFGRPYILKIDGCIHDGWISMQNFENVLISDFLYYLLSSDITQKYWKQKASSGTVQNLNADIVRATKIPIPPLPIQQEIVNILDRFTQLETELEAELEARRKQYEFYLNQLMEFEGKDVEWKALGNLAKIGDGLHGTPKYSLDGNYFFINGNNLVNGSVKYFESTKRVDDEMYKKHGINFIENKTVFLSINGTIGSLAIYKNEKIVLGKSVSYFNIEDDVLNPKFLYYYFQGNHSKYYFENKRTGSTIKNLGLGALRAFEIPVPPIEEQERIVSILDQFDALVNDTTIGLQAEIASRRKQYEYYRNKLLTFEEYE